MRSNDVTAVLLVLTSGLLASGLLVAPAAADPRPPVARVEPKVFEEHGRQRRDDYSWLRNDHDPAVVAYLEAENAYAKTHLDTIAPLVDELERELHRRVDGRDDSPEYVDNGWLYRRRMAEGERYPVIVRRKADGTSAGEEVVLDIASLAAGHRQYRLDDYLVSPDGRRVAFAVDFTGGRRHRIFVRDIATGAVDDTGLDGVASDLAFAGDSRTLFYLRTEDGTVRSHELWRHRLGSDPAADRLIYRESDPTFELSLHTTKSGRYVLLDSREQWTSEVRRLAMDDLDGEFSLIEPRHKGVAYFADHVGDRFFIRTNLDAYDFRIVSAPEDAPQARNWVDVVAGAPGRTISRFEVFETFLAYVEEHDAAQTVRVFRRDDMHELPVPRPAEFGSFQMRFMHGVANRDPGATLLKLQFSAPLYPTGYFDFDTATGELTLHKRSPAADWFDPSLYAVERILAPAPDGANVPVTLMYRRDQRRPGGNPTLVSGYGAYGFSLMPQFRSSWLGLIDRGFVHAIAHVRGGREMGRRWHDDGRVLRKMNSFTDFNAVTEALVAKGYADARRVFAQGGSAGGLLVAAASHLRPELYAGIVAEVPFVDVLGTMTDPGLPLTTLEYGEWGHPAVREEYETMLSYSPYDNVAAKTYPAMFVTAGLYDSQVRFHEPAKWVARLRATKTDANPILFLTNMATGHSGFSGRFGFVHEQAQITAWLLSMAGKGE
jgi:oligopeptidase B